MPAGLTEHQIKLLKNLTIKENIIRIRKLKSPKW